MFWLTRSSVTVGFVPATAIGVVAVLVAGATPETVTAVAGPAGAALGWHSISGESDRRAAVRERASTASLAVGLPGLVGAVVWALAAPPPLPVVAAVNGVAGEVVVASPAQNVSR